MTGKIHETHFDTHQHQSAYYQYQLPIRSHEVHRMIKNGEPDREKYHPMNVVKSINERGLFKKGK